MKKKNTGANPAGAGEGQREVNLVSITDDTSIHISAEILGNGDLRFSGQDLGAAPNEFFGDSDYEYWLTVPAAQKDAVLLLLLNVAYHGDPLLITKLRDMLTQQNVPHEFHCY
jgi:hypothetical protein